MCGLTGFLNPNGLADPNCLNVITDMANRLSHRGPDDSGNWIDRPAGIALGHRRLSVLDLSATGHQPMLSASGRYVVVFNGEIYNHLSLRNELPGVHWRGHSDTETLLAGVEAWGLTKTLQRSSGMFALAIWDRHKRSLQLARDRMGEKPLYYGWNNGIFLFGSELKSLCVYPEFIREIDQHALKLYFQFGYVPTPWSIYKGISKLAPGIILESNYGASPTEIPLQTAYWSLESTLAEGQLTPFAGSLDAAASELERHLLVSIKQQMLADVPVGAFLSGGLDSSTVVALMQSVSSRPIKTFTIGFEDKSYNEAPHASTVAKHLGTDHSELLVTTKEAINIIPQLSDIYDEPFGDSSAIPTLLVSQLTKKTVTVSLSGDGGDELLCGYKHYPSLCNTWEHLTKIPLGLRRIVGACIHAGSHKFMDPIDRLTGPLRGDISRIAFSERLRRISYFVAANDPVDLHRLFMSNWIEPSILLLQPSSLKSTYDELGKFPIERMMMKADLQTYLPDDLLVKVDRAGMSCGLETRMPLLDHHVVSFSGSLPVNLLLHQGQSKAPLRKLLKKFIPANMTDRPKQGFGVPLMQILLSPSIRSWAGPLLDPELINKQGLLNSHIISRRWNAMQTNGTDWSASIWLVLMFQSWLSRSK